MCAGVGELLERWTVDLEARPIQVRTPSEIFCFIFIRPRRIQLFLFVGNPVEKFFILYILKENDLGVLITNDLKLSAQCSRAAKTANRILGMIREYLHVEMNRQ